MKKQLKPAGKKGLESAGQDEGIINLENMVSDGSGEDVLDLTNEVSPEEQEGLEAGVIELTEKLPSSSDFLNEEDSMDESSDNVIHLSDMAVPSLPSNGSEDIEEITHEDIIDLNREVFDSTEDDDLAGLTRQLESAMATSYEELEDEEDEAIETLPEANLIEFEDFGNNDEVGDNFNLLPEAEPGMADNFDSIHMEELGEDDLFRDIQANDGDEEDSGDDISLDEEVSETAIELNRAMMADSNNRYQNDDDDDDELSEEIQNIRTKLDNVFPEEDSPDSFAAFNLGANNQSEDEEDFDTDELILPPFDEDEAGAFLSEPSSAKAPPFNLKPAPKSNFKEGMATGPRTKTKADPFEEKLNPPNAKRASLQKNATLSEAGVSITENELEAAVRHVIETKFGKKIERIILQAIERAVAREIAKVKKAILDESDSVE